jgi:DtxR family Mn-dependent transcriptional regulator
VNLTGVGQEAAGAFLHRYNVLVQVLVQELDFAPVEAHEEPERLEHAVSPRLTAAIAAKLGVADAQAEQEPSLYDRRRAGKRYPYAMKLARQRPDR